MKIVYLNVWGSEMTDNLVSYLEEQASDTDIFCFQEATGEMRRQSAHVFTGYDEISDYKYLAADDDFSQSILIKKGIELVSSGTILAEDRGVGLAVYVEIKIGDGLVYICNVHGRAQPSNKLDNPDRLRFSSGLIDFFKNKDGPIIIGGDFNLELTTESVEIFQKHDYRDLIKECNIQTTRNHLTWDRYPGNEMYYSDYVFLNNKVDLKNFTVQDNEVSDHLPMILEIETE